MAKSNGLNLVEIIRACAECGVLEFNHGATNIRFSGWTVQNKEVPVQSIEGVASPVVESSPESEETKPDLDDDLIIRDPLAYEESLIAASNQ